MIYFSDVFGVAPQALDQYGAFNIALVNVERSKVVTAFGALLPR